MRPLAARRRRLDAPAEAEGVPHLVFSVAGEEYALPLAGVREIIGLGGLSPVPNAPPTLRGVLSLRGERVAVVDLAAAFGGPGGSDSPESCALIVAGPIEDGQARPGLAVDAVSRVSSLAPEHMAPAPRLGTLIEVELVAAMARVQERLVPVLDLDRLLAAGEVRAAVGTRPE